MNLKIFRVGNPTDFVAGAVEVVNSNCIPDVKLQDKGRIMQLYLGNVFTLPNPTIGYEYNQTTDSINFPSTVSDINVFVYYN